MFCVIGTPYHPRILSIFKCQRFRPISNNMEATSGFTNFSYGQNTRFLNQAINKLRECGSEAILGEMPKIAVIGNQSAGKSSLIEAMSGVYPFPPSRHLT